MESTKSAPKKYIDELKDAGLSLLHFLKNPVEGMRTLPTWDWPLLLTCQAISAAAAGAISGIVARDFGRFFVGLIFIPISNLAISAIGAGFFYYTFTLIFRIPAEFRRVYTIIVFAALPALALHAISPVLPPLILVGMAATGLLLVVGFSEAFGISRQKLMRLMAVIYTLFFIFWIFNSITHKRHEKEFKGTATPESLDILEKELGN